MRAYRLAYDGRPYRGFQRQPDVETVEDELFGAFEALGIGTDPSGYAAAGRTDAGASAVAQTVAFDAPEWCTPAALNGELPPSVRAWASASVAETFHATHDAVRRTYDYHLYAPRGRTDEEAVRAAAEGLAGHHDFHNLTPDDDGTERTVALSLVRDGEFLTVRAAAGGFARQLVRRIAGLLDGVGRGEIDPGRVDVLLDDDPVDGSEGVGPAPAEPLVLADVDYPGITFDADPDAVESVTDVFGSRQIEGLGSSRALATVVHGVSFPS